MNIQEQIYLLIEKIDTEIDIMHRPGLTNDDVEECHDIIARLKENVPDLTECYDPLHLHLQNTLHDMKTRNRVAIDNMFFMVLDQYSCDNSTRDVIIAEELLDIGYRD